MQKKQLSLKELEEGSLLSLDFYKLSNAIKSSPDIIPVAVQNIDTLEVILIAYTNEYALNESVATGIATFWSTSRNELWIKGKGSGNTFNLLEIRVNCEQNSVVYLVKPNGEGICHTYNSNGTARNCFYRRFNNETQKLEFVNSLEK